MTDDISKVDNPWREFIENCIAGSNYFRSSEYRRLLADLDRLYRLESATTPAEVDKDWQLISGYRSSDGITRTAVYWCANTGALKTETTSDGRFRAGEGPHIRRPTLARQLAEAKAEANDANMGCIEALDRAEQAESQLAAATRRLGEVRPIMDELVQCANVGRWDGKLIRAAQDWLAALTKEPTK